MADRSTRELVERSRDGAKGARYVEKQGGRKKWPTRNACGDTNSTLTLLFIGSEAHISHGTRTAVGDRRMR